MLTFRGASIFFLSYCFSYNIGLTIHASRTHQLLGQGHPVSRKTNTRRCIGSRLRNAQRFRAIVSFVADIGLKDATDLGECTLGLSSSSPRGSHSARLQRPDITHSDLAAASAPPYETFDRLPSQTDPEVR